MRKNLKTVSMAILFGTLLGVVSCGDPSSSEPSSSQQPSSEQPSSEVLVPGRNLDESAWQVPNAGWNDAEVTINFYSTMGKELVESITPFIEDFEKMYPSIKVEHTQPGGYDQVRDQIKTELSTGQGPDLAYCYPDHVALYNKTKTVVTLDNLITDPQIGLKQEQEEVQE